MDNRYNLFGSNEKILAILTELADANNSDLEIITDDEDEQIQGNNGINQNEVNNDVGILDILNEVGAGKRL